MAGSAAKVVISERQERVLRKLSTATTVAKRLVQRATIILLAFSGVANQDIAKEVGLGRCQVGIWRRRWRSSAQERSRAGATWTTAAVWTWIRSMLPCVRTTRSAR